jgi:hypothetical protein
MKKIAFISILVLLFASTTVWACWNCYGHRPNTSYSQTKSSIEIESKYSERLDKFEADLELKQLEIYKLLDNPESTVGQVTAKEQEFDSIESEYLQLVDEMKQELVGQGVRPRHYNHPMRQQKQPHMGYGHQGGNLHGYGPGGCWQ